MLKLCKVTKVKVLFSVLVSFFIHFKFNSFKSVAAILEKGLLALFSVEKARALPLTPFLLSALL